ncbi:MAG: ethanolamine ammonia-lyase subunit EutC [Zhongshania sp.]|uniref:ethanolamine ammonia-lyase subunit EutC n=1 Tax=Zhongshania sp. TaxID=1971902 RepID=UPI00262AE8CE|nr:ethanolamine ammonia-lyase subunit EutC [Zhongshania sp.]MDF1693616.1 ethanolamine ammonia-lyase subunit EutC [Zhongshania sp.]
MSSKSPDRWLALGDYTSARIALGRTGVSATTANHLQFQLDHARARDAVHQAFDPLALAAQCKTALAGISNALFPEQVLCSLAANRQTYLQRPDLGRQLPEAQWQLLRDQATGQPPIDVALIIGDGLSSAAIAAHAVAVLRLLAPALHKRGLQLGPLCIASQARVALADDIGEALKAKLSVMLIGERPGLSSPDSLGMYITYGPQRGRSDAERNCISNIRTGGLGYSQAVDTALYLLQGAIRKGLSGTILKDESTNFDVAARGIPFLK